MVDDSKKWIASADEEAPERVASEDGTAREFDSEDVREAGKKGGKVARDTQEADVTEEVGEAESDVLTNDLEE